VPDRTVKDVIAAARLETFIWSATEADIVNLEFDIED
jgi:hypothetical protein